MKNSIEAARELITYFGVNRQVGHTSAVMAGAFETGALVVVHNMEMSNHILKEWNMLKEPSGVDIITIGDVANGKLRGTNKRPLLIDNAALFTMLGDVVGWADHLEAKNAKLEQKINRALADLS